MKTTFKNLSSDLTIKKALRQLFILQMELETMRQLTDDVQPELDRIIHSIDLIFESILKMDE